MTASARSSASGSSLNPNWPHYASAAAVAVVVLGSVLRWGLLGGSAAGAGTAASARE